MKEVAAAAGVSPMSVSNALNGRRPVSRQTRAAVMEAVEQLGYRVNVAARSLREGRTGVVGIAVPTLESDYYSVTASRLARALAREGLATVVEETGARWEREVAVLRDSRINAYDALVISPVGLSEEELKAFSGELPLVVLGEQELHRAVDRVGMGNTEGAALATQLLLDRGCRRLAVVGSPPLDDLDDADLAEGQAFLLRARSSAATARAHGGVRLQASYSGAMLVDGAACADDLLARFRDVDGVFCVTDTLAFGLMRRFADLGVRVPDDVRVVGFDDVEHARYSIPSLSTVDPGHVAMAEAVVGLLRRRLDDPDAEPREFVGPVRLVERESTR